MKKNKKFFNCLLTAGMILSLAACGKGNDSSTPADPAKPAAQSTTQDNNNSQDTGSAETSSSDSGYKLTVPAKLSGKLNLIELEDRDPSVLRGIKITGNNIGSVDDINGKESSLDDIRTIFLLNEWVSFYPDTDKEYSLRVWVLKHRDDHEYYVDCKFSDLMPDFATYCDLHYPVDSDTPDETSWGDFYLNMDEFEPGYYDFVFTYNGKAIATLVTRFYKDTELGDKSGSELESLMHE